MNISEKAFFFLEASGWTQAQLAQAIGVHVTNLNRFLNRRVKRVSIPEKLAGFFASQEAKDALAASSPNPSTGGGMRQ